MSEHDNGGPAFPIASDVIGHCVGMTLRDWFAGQALAGLLASPQTGDDANAVIRAAFSAADAMIAARKGGAA